MSYDLIETTYADVPQEILAAYDRKYSGILDDVGGTNWITFANSRFHVKSGGQDTVLQTPHLDVVIFATTSANHKVWYQAGYNASQPYGVGPTAVWMEGGPIPSNVPEWVWKTKKQTGQGEVNHFQYRRRLAVALCGSDGGHPIPDLDTIYGMDISGASLFGKSVQPYYTGTALFEWFKNNNLHLPAVPVRVVFKHDATVPTLRFAPFTRADGRPWIFPSDELARIFTRAVGSEVERYLDQIGRAHV